MESNRAEVRTWRGARLPNNRSSPSSHTAKSRLGAARLRPLRPVQRLESSTIVIEKENEESSSAPAARTAHAGAGAGILEEEEEEDEDEDNDKKRPRPPARETLIQACELEPIVHECIRERKCVHVWVPIGFKQSPFNGQRCCLPIITPDNCISGVAFQELTGYSSLLRNRLPPEDRKIGTRHMVPIRRRRNNGGGGGGVGGDKVFYLSSLRNVLYNISEKWLAANCRPEEWQGGQKALIAWGKAHFQYLRDYPVDLGGLSRKLNYLDLLDHDHHERNHSSSSSHQNGRKEDDDNDDEEVYEKSSRKEVGKRKHEKRRRRRKGEEEEEQKSGQKQDAENVEIRISSIIGAGEGVFTKKSFKKGQVVGRYIGKIINNDTLKKMSAEDANKVISLVDPSGTERMIDGRGLRHFSSHINHKWRTDTNGLGDANLFVTREGQFVCLRDIAVGEELFIDYGPAYWYFQMYHKDLDDVTDHARRLACIQTVLAALPN